MSTNNIIYRPEKLPNESENILKLMSICFKREFSRDWFEWFNLNCPFGKNNIFIAEDLDNSDIVGVYGLLPYKCIINNKIVDSLLCTNVMTHPDYGGRGIFTQLGRYALSSEFKNGKFKFSLGVPNANAIKGHLKIGWTVFSNLTFYKKHINAKTNFEGEQIFEFTDDHGAFATKISMNNNFSVLKNSDFLNWRYFERPDKEYIIYEIRSNGVLSGFIVLKYFDANNYKKLHILDIYAVNDVFYMKLIDIATSLASDCDELNCWQIDNSQQIKPFLQAGFVSFPEKNILIMFNNKVEDPIEDKWLFTLGDNDVY